MIRKSVGTLSKPYSKQELLLEKIQGMLEIEFTRAVLIPLLMKMGFDVDENGGPGEGGKDLICWRKGDFGIMELTVVQVKKTTPSAAAADGASFSGIVNQLQQATEQEVGSKFGVRQKPNAVYFITPFQLNTRALESRFEGYRELAARRVLVLDGGIIVGELMRLLPELANDLCGENFTIKSRLLSNVSNADLLSALNYRKERDIDEFYCDLDFGVGRITSKLFFSLQFNPKIHKTSFPPPRWAAIESFARQIREKTGCDIIIGGIETVTSSYSAEYAKYKAEANQLIVRNVRSTYSEIENLLRFVLDECNEIVNDALHLASQDVFGNKARLALTEEEALRLEQLKQARVHIEDEVSRLFAKTDLDTLWLGELKAIMRAAEEEIEHLRAERAILNSAAAGRLTSFFRSMVQLNKLYAFLIEERAKQIDEPEIVCEIDGHVLATQLLAYQNSISEGLQKMTAQEMSRNEIRDFLGNCQDVFVLVDSVLDDRSLNEAVGVSQKQTYSLDSEPRRIHMPIKDVFATGIHFAVFGEAGAGKSTTLYRYASEASQTDSEDEITLFVPLTRLLSGHKAALGDHTADPLVQLETALAQFLNVKNNASEADVIRFLRSKKKVTFIFDGVDEVIKSSPWIVDAIHEVASTYINCQVIISARSSGHYLDSTKFLSLTLLPFTAEQVKSFVARWFKNTPLLSEKVITHLSSTVALVEIVTNPLLATVLCVLAENDVPLPEGEIGMYAERMKLLLGHYDTHKQAKRLTTHHSILETTAKKLAFHLHKTNNRFVAPSELERIAVSVVGRIYSKVTEEQLRVAVRELIDPCNILQPMTDDGAFGFGHLRFQEYLCAAELCSNRGVELRPLLTSTWWRSVLVLFARMTDDIRYIVEDIIGQQHNVSKYRDTLLAMVQTRPKAQRSELRRIVNSHAALDRTELDLKEFSEYEDSLVEHDDWKGYWHDNSLN